MILRKRAVWSELFIPPDLILRSPEGLSILIEHSRNCLNPDSKMNLMHNMLKSCTCTESACPCPILIKNNQLLLVLAHAISIVRVHYLCMIWYFASFNNCTNCHVFFHPLTECPQQELLVVHQWPQCGGQQLHPWK